MIEQTVIPPEHDGSCVEVQLLRKEVDELKPVMKIVHELALSVASLNTTVKMLAGIYVTTIAPILIGIVIWFITHQ